MDSLRSRARELKQRGHGVVVSSPMLAAMAIPVHQIEKGSHQPYTDAERAKGGESAADEGEVDKHHY
jgi:hypothetical protein